MVDIPLDPSPPAPEHRHWLAFVRAPWFIVLVSGLAIWLLSALITSVTRDQILVPTVILVGSFVAPVAVVTFAIGRLEAGHLRVEAILAGFILGGTLGVLTAALIETYFLPSANGTFLGVGLIEEGCKGAIVIAVGATLKNRRVHDGLVLGAIVGAGFAAFESAGYAFSTLLHHTGDHEIADVMSTEMTRAVFAPFAHITWTALFGAALFASVRPHHFRVFSRGVILTFIGIVALHAAWDASNGFAIFLTKGIVQSNWQVEFPNTEEWVGLPTDRMLTVWSVIYDGLLIINGMIGVGWLIHEWRKHPSSLELDLSGPTAEPA
jgi:RsiW-degrading membrane proteinase PrsW (M82 family)